MEQASKGGSIKDFSKTIKKGAANSIGCATGVCAGFRDFILRGNVVDLAVAVVVGTAFTALVNAFVSDWLTPLIAVMFGSTDGTFGSLSFTVRGSVFNYGHFVNQLITFLCICIIVYFVVVLPVNTLMRLVYPEKKTRNCPECLSEIPVKASRCKFCCAAVPPLPTKLTAFFPTKPSDKAGEADPEKGMAGAEEEDGVEVWRKAEAVEVAEERRGAVI